MDTHFYVDNAPPGEVCEVLRVLSSNVPFTATEIGDMLLDQFGFQMQKDRTYSPRRLMDLTLAQQVRKGGKAAYILSERGELIQNALDYDSGLVMDLLHYLHYTGYQGRVEDRKLFWSYRRCCETLWSVGHLIPPSELAPQVQASIYAEFPQLDPAARTGARFNSTAVSAVYTWLRALEPSPIGKVGAPITPRRVKHFELAVLALDEIYRSKGYHYDDPVLMDRAFLHQVAGVFFMDIDVCSTFLATAARIIPNVIHITDTLSGPAVRLRRPYSIESLSL